MQCTVQFLLLALCLWCGISAKIGLECIFKESSFQPEGVPSEGVFQPEGAPQRVVFRQRGSLRGWFQTGGAPSESGFQTGGAPSESGFQPEGAPSGSDFQPEGAPSESGFQPTGWFLTRGAQFQLIYCPFCILITCSSTIKVQLFIPQTQAILGCGRSV